MKGKILDFDIQSSEGVISADDGKRYTFSTKQWESSDISPEKNIEVDFTAEEQIAIEIYAIKKEDTSPQTITVVTAPTSSAAVVSMIFGIGGLFFTWWILGLPSLIAIITGHIAKSNIKNSNGTLGGSGFATAGLVLGYLVLIGYLLVAFVFVGALASMGNSY